MNHSFGVQAYPQQLPLISCGSVIASFLCHRYPSWYFKQFYKWIQIELWSIYEVLIDSIVIWVNMDPSLVIKGVDKNIKICFPCCAFVFHSLSLSLCRKWLAERMGRLTDSQDNSKLQNEGKTLQQQRPWKNTSHGLRMDHLGCQWLGTPGNDCSTLETIP